MRKLLLLVTLFFFTLIASQAQSTSELNTLRRINPNNPNSAVWNNLSNTSKYISVGVPVGYFVAGMIHDNKALKQKAAYIAAAIILNTASTTLLKNVVKRERPYHTYTGIFPDKIKSDFAFPSGHTSSAFATATSLALATKKWHVAVPAFVWSAGVGYSRIYLGQHYPSDVIMGALVGTSSAIICHLASKQLTKRKKSKMLQIK
ncbi:MAG: phosphatase PAP2 family protein [Bacteroidota bacterium]|jgi:membrane-associated phospholipid phosphatase